jgi:hypothetical protein
MSGNSMTFSLFALHCIPTEEHMFKKVRNGLRQELKQWLIVLRFKSMRELIEAAQALEAYIGEDLQGHQRTSKKRDGDDFTSRLPFQRRKKSGMFEVIIERNALIETLGIHRVCNNQVKVTNNPSR